LITVALPFKAERYDGPVRMHGRLPLPLAVALAATVIAGAACSTFDGAPATATEDAGGPDALAETSPDAGVTCSATAAFAAPLFVGGLDNQEIYSATFSADELRAIIAARIPPASDYHLYAASRASNVSPFALGDALTGVQLGGIQELFATESTDGARLFYETSFAPATTTQYIYQATRVGDGGYADASEVTALSGTGPEGVGVPFVARHASELWFSTATLDADIYRAAIQNDGSVGAPVRVEELATASNETAPVLSSDGLVIYYASARGDGNAKGDLDIWVATRASVDAPFGDLHDVAELSTTDADFPAWLSSDRCRLYFVRHLGADARLYVAKR